MQAAVLGLLGLLASSAMAQAPPGGGPPYEWDGPCPGTWPPLPANPQSEVQIAVRAVFTPSATADCSKKFGGSISKTLSKVVNTLLTRARRESSNQVFVKIKVAPTIIIVCRPDVSVINFFIKAPVIKGASSDPMTSDYTQTLRTMADNFHLADFCPADQVAHPYVYSSHSYAADMDAWCLAAGGGTRLLEAKSCVQNAPVAMYEVGRAACFPGDATVVRADPATGHELGPARIDELAIGDAVRCLAPAALAGEGAAEGAAALLGGYRDDEQAYVPSTCRVFSYLHVDPAREAPFVALHYTDDRGRPAKLRATGEHLVYLAPPGLAAGATGGTGAGGAARLLAELPPGGAARRADAVEVGDLLAVAASGQQGLEGAGGPKLYVARVTKITREPGAGIYAPLLTKAGLPLVDGAAAFSGVQLIPGAAPHPAQNLGEYYRHVRMWADLGAALASGCSGAECPCLDAPQDPVRPCVRLGTRLADVPPGLSDYALRSHAVHSKALAEGRTYPDYARGIPLGRAYAAHSWLPALARGLGFKPHTLGLLVTDALLVRPPKAAGGNAGGGAAAAAS